MNKPPQNAMRIGEFACAIGCQPLAMRFALRSGRLECPAGAARGRWLAGNHRFSRGGMACARR